FRHNGEADPQTAPSHRLLIPFDWLVHLDRPLVSPLELIHVSAVAPHQLTPSFMVAPPPGSPATVQPDRFRHTAPWIVSNIKTGASPPTRDASVVQGARIYRALE